ncbi:hypothetical protein TUBRATIS_20540 [Tubulinosema ratisbonensis]|uniref:Uncharacterized protein n=1 Tax=Tubulinosema ratisbonensis TaxID=291195 RepID=A0A437AJX7_9MICR|nr:hypothetical protein TUBRATIS_20540 [Tubulinosema ratisbonensis]
MVKYLKERKNLDKFNINYINMKKSLLRVVIYLILLCEKRNDFRYIISNYAEIYKKTIERVINHFINKYKDINESTKKILNDTNLLHLKIQLNKKNTDINMILNNFIKMHCYFQMAQDLYYIMIMIFENKELHKYTEEKSELKAYHREMLSNKILNEEFFDYFEFINARDLLKWVKNSVMRYKEQAELKKEEHKKHKNNRKLEITKLLDEIQTTILKIRHSQSVLDKPIPLLDEHFFENLEKTFDSYCLYFLNIIDFWYSLDIYSIKKDILMSFCKYLIDNDLVLDISDKNEFINMLKEYIIEFSIILIMK